MSNTNTAAAVVVTKPFKAILAGLKSIRGSVADTAEGVDTAMGVFVQAASKVVEPSSGTVTTGRFTALHIMEFQDRLYGHNMLPGWGFTDLELAVAWRGEFPAAKCNFAEKRHYVTSARNDLNRGRRGLRVAQLNAQYGFTGDVARFFGKVKADKAQPAQPAQATSKSQAKKEAKVAKRKAKAAPQPAEVPVETVTAPTGDQVIA
jgi:hypothetical protein